MSVKKWCIIDKQDYSFLRWYRAVLTFDTKESAQRFLNSVTDTAAINTECLVVMPFAFHTMDATNLICIRNGDDIELKEVE